MNKMTRLLLPYFPDNEVLNKSTLHRFVKVISIVWGIVIGIALLYALYYMGNNAFHYLTTKTEGLIKITNTETGESKTITYQQLGAMVNAQYPEYNDHTDYEIGQAFSNANTDTKIDRLLEGKFDNITSLGLSKKQWGKSTIQTLPSLLIVVVLLFLPAILYRAILYIVIGSWNGKK